MWRKFAVWSGKQSKYIKICFCLLAIANHPVKQENPSFTNITASLDNCHFVWLGWLFQKEISNHLQYLEPYTKWLAVQSLLQTNEVPVGWQAWQAVNLPAPGQLLPHPTAYVELLRALINVHISTWSRSSGTIHDNSKKCFGYLKFWCHSILKAKTSLDEDWV